MRGGCSTAWLERRIEQEKIEGTEIFLSLFSLFAPVEFRVIPLQPIVWLVAGMSTGLWRFLSLRGQSRRPRA